MYCNEDYSNNINEYFYRISERFDENNFGTVKCIGV